MSLKTVMTALVLTLLPSLSLAMTGCSNEHRAQTAMSCVEGMIIDEETGDCVPVVTG